MTYRPIIFSAPMVRAILAGRKTMTRRRFRHERRDPADSRLKIWVPTPWSNVQIGDSLWVREGLKARNMDLAAALGLVAAMTTVDPTRDDLCISYAADDEPAVEHGFDLAWVWKRLSVPAIHMPRWASRITLAVTAVRVDRLQNISGEDAIAEGIDPAPHRCGCERCAMTSELCPATSSSLVMAFGELWNSIHGPGAWEANPLVVAITFVGPAAETGKD